MRQRISLLLAIAFLLVSCGQNQGEQQSGTPGTQQENTVSNGKQLFINYCAQCHALNEDKNGPKLAGVVARWHNDTNQIAAFIRNSQQVINSGQNTYATQLFHTWSNSLMPPFSNLSDDDIKAIIDYINKGVE